MILKKGTSGQDKTKPGKETYHFLLDFPTYNDAK